MTTWWLTAQQGCRWLLGLPFCCVCFALKPPHPLPSERGECRGLVCKSSPEGLLDWESANQWLQWLSGHWGCCLAESTRWLNSVCSATGFSYTHSWLLFSVCASPNMRFCVVSWGEDFFHRNVPYSSLPVLFLPSTGGNKRRTTEGEVLCHC